MSSVVEMNGHHGNKVDPDGQVSSGPDLHVSPEGRTGSSSLSDNSREGSSSGYDSSSSSGSGSSDEEADSEPLRRRRASSGEPSGSGGTRRSQQKPAAGNGGEKKRKRRSSAFPKIAAKDRCGHCHTCLNPQMKKACLTRRAEMEQRLRLQPPPPAKRARTSSDGSGSGTGGGARGSAQVAVQLADALKPLTTRRGGINPGMTRPFLALMRAQQGVQSRSLFCTVVGLSDAAVLSMLMGEGALEVLQEWVASAKENISADGSVALLESALTALLPFPVTLETMKQHKGLTQLLGALRRAEQPQIKAKARELVDTWMARAPQGAPGQGSKPAPTLQKQGSGNIAVAPLQRQSSGTAPTQSHPDAGAAYSDAPAAKRVKTEQAGRPTPTSVPIKPAAAGNGTAQAGASGSNHISMVSDNDMFKKAAAAHPGQRTMVGARVTSLQAPGKVQLLDILKSERPVPGGAAPTTTAPAAAGIAPGTISLKLVVDADEHIAVQLQVAPSPGSTNAAAAGGAARGSVSQGVRLGSLSGAGAGPSVTRIGGAAQVPLLGALALQPLQQHSKPEDAPRRVARTNKRVQWQPDTKLVAVRWFNKEDAPVQAQADAVLTEAERAAATEVQRARFGAAARLEHMNEREEHLKAHREAELAHRELMDRLQAMSSNIAWYEPPLSAPLPDDVTYAAGEASTMRNASDHEPGRHVIYTSVHHCPETPQEPVGGQDGYGGRPFGYAEVLIPLHPSTVLQQPQPQQQMPAQQQQQQQLGFQMPQAHAQPRAMPSMQGGGLAAPGLAGPATGGLLSALSQLKHVLPAGNPASAGPAANGPGSSFQGSFPANGLQYPGMAGPSQQGQYPGPPAAQHEGPHMYHQQQQQQQQQQPQQHNHHPVIHPLPHWVNRRPCKWYNSDRGCNKGDLCDFMHLRDGGDDSIDVRQLYPDPMPLERPEFGGRGGRGSGMRGRRGGGRIGGGRGRHV